MEGNRRVTCLKILQNPTLIDLPTFASLKKKFQKLHDKDCDKLLTKVNCVIYDDPSEANVWVKLKHGGQNNGVGTVEWDAQQNARFEEKVYGKSPIALQTINLLKTSSSVSPDIKKQLNSIPITNLDRLLSDPDVRTFLGMELNNGNILSYLDEAEVLKGLIYVAQDLLTPHFSVKKIYTKEDRRDYIKQFPKKCIPNADKKLESPWLFSKSSTKSSTPTSYSIPIPPAKERRVLIPRKCIIKISNPKINAIYHELQILDIIRCTNAGAVLFRVFIELSLDCFISTNKVPKVNRDSKLREKAVEVTLFLENKSLADKHFCKGIRSAVSEKDGVLGVDTFNSYVHNIHFSPTPEYLIVAWDNIQAFMIKIWEHSN